MTGHSYDEFVAAMNRKARSGAYDNRHPIKDLKERAKGGDDNARSALRMRTGEDVEKRVDDP